MKLTKLGKDTLKYLHSRKRNSKPKYYLQTRLRYASHSILKSINLIHKLTKND